MRKFAVLIFLALEACAPGVPPFDFGLCIQSCTACEIDGCGEICAQASRQLLNPNCHLVTETAWYCAVSNGCNFVDVCSDEINDFLTCE